jgi:hypothetical protein
MESAIKIRRASRTASAAVFVFSLLLLWAACAAVLWWTYDIGAFIRGGAYKKDFAISWVTQFSCIVSSLTAAVWLRCRFKHSSDSVQRVAWTVCWQTGTVLLLYSLVIIARRETWSSVNGLSDWAMFFGSVNARFFSEAGPWSFVFVALPCMSTISAALFSLQSLVVRKLPSY